MRVCGLCGVKRYGYFVLASNCELIQWKQNKKLSYRREITHLTLFYHTVQKAFRYVELGPHSELRSVPMYIAHVPSCFFFSTGIYCNFIPLNMHALSLFLITYIQCDVYRWSSMQTDRVTSSHLRYYNTQQQVVPVTMSRQRPDRDLWHRLSFAALHPPTLSVPSTSLPRRLERHDLLRETLLPLRFQLQHEPDPAGRPGWWRSRHVANAGCALRPVDDAQRESSGHFPGAVDILLYEIIPISFLIQFMWNNFGLSLVIRFS